LREQRQVGVVDAHGDAASFTGSECFDWAGGTIGEGYAAQGNILAGRGVIGAMAEAFERTEGDLATRLVASLAAGDAAGGDRRGRQSAGLLVVSPAGGYGGTSDVVADLRVDDHQDPARELARLLDIHRVLFTKPAEADLIAIDAELDAEISAALVATGYAKPEDSAEELRRALERFAGWENLEERIVAGPHIDRHVLAALRTSTTRASRKTR
jgi:uncharacterized Ntn-hydrolase superfamily protein